MLRTFQRIHPLNWPLALFASLSGPVRYWRSEYVPQRLLRRFTFLDPAEFFSLEEWQDELEAAFDRWRDAFDASKPQFVLKRRVLGVDVDFSGNWQQWLAIQHEERHLFLALAARAQALTDAGGTGSRLDRAWNTIVCLLHAGRAAMAALRAPAQPWPDKPAALWNGISTSEYAEAEQRLDFSFLARRGLAPANEHFFFLPRAPGGAVTERLSRAGVRWGLLTNLGGTGSGWRTALAIAWSAMRELLRADDPFRAGMAIRYSGVAAAWIALQRRLGARLYLTSISNAWPEGPEVAALRAMGVVTVNWAYSGNAFRFARGRHGYRDRGLLRSIAVADELWVWNAEFRDWLEARRTGAPRKVEIIGPTMAGDSRWLEHSPAAARERYGVRGSPNARFVALFDVATLNQAHRRLYGFGPTTAPLDMLSQLYLDARRLLDEHPEMHLILKPKRSFDEATREYPDSLRDLLQSPAKDRILVLDHRIDPYIPVAIADACIGNPFVSPVIAAIESGRTGLFHDPLAQVMDFFPAGYRGLLSHSYAELKARLQAPAGRPVPIDPGRDFADRINSLLHDRKTQTL